MDLRIKSSDRCCFFGRTGSGKTTLAKSLLRGARRWVVFDPKHTFEEPGGKVVKRPERRLARQIVRVPFRDEQYHWQAALHSVWRMGRRILYIDEVNIVNPSRTVVSEELGRAIRTGRERGLGVWSASQRPKDIPSVVFTEAEHFFIFRLQYEADREKVASFTGERILPLLEGLRGHQFVYYNVMNDEMQLMELKLRGR